MSATLDCPEIECWRGLLADTLPPNEREQWERHLESCAACQERLDRTEERGDELLSLARRIGDPTAGPTDQTLSVMLARLHEVKSPLRATPVEAAELYFLRSTDRPGVLGTLGAYEVQEVIGQGGMGVVLKAFDPPLHRLVAIKVMAAAVAGSATARRRFTREAQAAAAVCHDHIVAVHGVHETDGLPYLVMQYVAGESLQARLDRTGPLELAEIVRIGLQTASGLAAAHAQGLIHRDIKPANLLLENGLARVKITDFGLARMVDDVTLTQNGVVAGTPEYMAPEQARGEAVDHRADLFSLGSVLYALCVGLPPFRGATTVAVLRLVSDQEPAPIRARNPDVPAWLEALVFRLLAKDPADRFQSAAEVATLLEGYLAHLRQPTTVPAPELPAGPADAGFEQSAPEVMGWMPRRRWLAAFAALVALGMGTAFWFAGAGGQLNLKQESTPEYYHSFKGEQENRDDFELIGPDADQCVKFEPEGLRITLPTGHAGKRIGTGVAANMAIKGDFEVTISFEILKEPDRAKTKQGAGLFLGVDVNTEAYNRATLSRGTGEHGRFTTWFQLTEDGADLPYTEKIGNFPAETTAGRLRLVRSDAVLSYQVAEEGSDQFTVLVEYPFSKLDLKQIRIGGQTNGPGASLDCRFIDLRIRAGTLPPASVAKATPPKAGGNGWLAALLIAGLVIAASLGGWLFLRQRRLAEIAPTSTPEPDMQAIHGAVAATVAFSCTGCGRSLQVKVALAGKKGKCARCGHAIVVPARQK